MKCRFGVVSRVDLLDPLLQLFVELPDRLSVSVVVAQKEGCVDVRELADALGNLAMTLRDMGNA